MRSVSQMSGLFGCPAQSSLSWRPSLLMKLTDEDIPAYLGVTSYPTSNSPSVGVPDSLLRQSAISKEMVELEFKNCSLIA